MGMSEMNLDAVSKEELLRALIYMASEYLESQHSVFELDHLHMQAGEYTCEILAKVGAIKHEARGGRWLIDPWVEPFKAHE